MKCRLVDDAKLQDLKQFAQELMMEPDTRQDGENVKRILEKLDLWEDKDEQGRNG